MSETTDIDQQVDLDGRAKIGAFLDTVKPKQPKSISVRQFLGFWGYKKRGAHILRSINRELSRRGLCSSPDIALADYYGDINILDQLFPPLVLNRMTQSLWVLGVEMHPRSLSELQSKDRRV